MCLQVSRASSGPLHMDSSFTLVYSRLWDTAEQTRVNTQGCGLRVKRRGSVAILLEVLWVLGQGHLYDVEAVVVVFLSREQQGQQVKGVDIIALKLQRLSNIA